MCLLLGGVTVLVHHGPFASAGPAPPRLRVSAVSAWPTPTPGGVAVSLAVLNDGGPDGLVSASSPVARGATLERSAPPAPERATACHA